MKDQISIESCFEFTEWVGLHYLRMNKVWCHKFRDQRDKENWITTEELYKYWEEELVKDK